MTMVSLVTHFPSITNHSTHSNGITTTQVVDAYDSVQEWDVPPFIVGQAPISQMQVRGPGSYAIGQDGSMFTLGANGEVYKDAVQMPGLAASIVVAAGKHLYAKGRTDATWWTWTGSGWTRTTGNIDATVLP